jgi:hypothetical protein
MSKSHGFASAFLSCKPSPLLAWVNPKQRT